MTGALGSNAPLPQSKRSVRDRVLAVAEFVGIRINLEEYFSEILSLGGVLRPLL